MARLYFLPMFEDVYKPYYKHNNQISKYKKTPFERVVMPIFEKGAREILPKYEKVGDYQDFGDTRWFRKPFHAKQYYYNVVSLIIDGKTSNISHMITCLDIPNGNHHVKIEMTAYNYNPLEKSGDGLKGTQIAKDYAELDLCAEDGNYFIVATHKTQKGAYVYNSPYNDGASCIKNTFFEYHSVQASLLSLSSFLSYFDKEMDFQNIDIKSLKGSSINGKNSYESCKSNTNNTATLENTNSSVSVSHNESTVDKTPVSSTKTTSIKTQKKLSNNEYFDLLVNSVSTTPSKENTTVQKQKETPKKSTINYVTDSDPKYSELYDDGTLVYKFQSEVYIPRQVTKIDKYFLWKNEHVKKVVFPDNITSLVEYELRECPKLEEVVLPKNLKDFSYNCIAYSPNLKSIYLDEKNLYFIVIDGVLYKKIDGGSLNLVLYPVQKENEYFQVPTNCTMIDAFAFNGNKHLKRVDLTSVTYVELSAFAFCSNLEEVKFGKGMTSIKSFGFENTALNKVELPISTKIGSEAFPKGCKVKKKLFFK